MLFHSNRRERSRLRTVLKGQFTVSDAGSTEELIRHLAKRPALAFVEFLLPQSKGADLVRLVRQTSPKTEVIVLSPVDAPSFAVVAIKAGAFGFLTTKERPEEILTLAYEALDERELSHAHRGDTVAGVSRSGSSTVRSAYERLAGLASSDEPCLILGELGTGRKTAARAMHRLSPTGGLFRFIDVAQPARLPLRAALNIVALAPKTDRDAKRAIHNTLCVLNCDRLTQEEVTELSEISQQPVLVRLTNGSTITIAYRVIGIATQTHNPDDSTQPHCLATPTFNDVIELPPLRRRMEDLPVLCAELAQRWGAKYGIRPKQFSIDAIDVLSTYCWPANILELSNLIERLTLTSSTEIIEASQLPFEIHIGAWKRGITYREAMVRLEREFLNRILDKVGGCRRRAAERLQLSYSTLKFRLRKVGVGNRAESDNSGGTVLAASRRGA